MAKRFDPMGAQIKSAERRLVLRQMVVSAALLLSFATTVIAMFYHQEHRAMQGRLEVFTLAVSESVEDEHVDPGFEDSSFLGPQSPQPHDRRLQWLDLSGTVIVDRGSLPFHNQPVRTGISVQRKPVPVLVETLLCYNDENPRRPYGFTRVAVSLDPIDDMMTQLLWDLGLGLLVALFLAAFCSRYLALQALKPTWVAYQQISRFSADASHELRNPLAAVLCNVELLQEQGALASDPEFLESLDRIHDAARQMASLVESLLTLARTADFGLEQATPFPLADLIEEVVARFDVPAKAAGVDLQSHLEDVTFAGNEVLIASLVGNLVENALRHSVAGGRVEVRLTQQRSAVVLEVEDTGCGIASADLPHVFDRFWRCDKARSPGSGSGLGLSLAKAIVEAHRGSIEVVSQIDRGSTFRARFPAP